MLRDFDKDMKTIRETIWSHVKSHVGLECRGCLGRGGECGWIVFSGMCTKTQASEFEQKMSGIYIHHGDGVYFVSPIGTRGGMNRFLVSPTRLDKISIIVRVSVQKME